MSVVGIDLGTTNTVVACMQDGRVHVLADEHGNRLLPSVVSFHPNGDVLVGEAAKARRLVDAPNTIASIKRLIGRPWDSEEIRLARSRFAFELREGPGQGALVVARGEAYTLPEISAFVLKRVRQIAEAALGETVDKAVITVPAHFNELQRASTKVAGRVAGLEVLRILNEPTAAALAYGFGSGQSERVVVYDFGGGTFDCSLLDLTGTLFEVLATAGDTFLGGDDIDTAIAETMCNAFLAQHRYDPRVDPQAFERLRSAAERIKRDLSVNMQAQVDLPEVAYGLGGKRLGLSFGMTQADLDAIASPYIERTLQVTQDALSVAHLSPSSFDQVVLVGGSTRMPLVKRRVESFFGLPVMDRVNPDEVVAIGAAVQAAALVDASRKRSIPAPPKPGVIGPPIEPADLSLTEVSARNPDRKIKSLPPVPVHPTQPSAQPAAPAKQTLRPAGAPPLPPPAPVTMPTPFAAFFPGKDTSDPHDKSLTAMTGLGSSNEDHSFASSNTLPLAAEQTQPRPGPPPLPPRAGAGRGNTLRTAQSPAAAEPPSITQPPHTEPMPTLPQMAGGAAGPKIVAPPTPWPGWKPEPVGPLATEDISRIMPDAMNRSLSTKSPVITGPGALQQPPTAPPLFTEDISRIMPDAMNRSLATKSPVSVSGATVQQPPAAPPLYTEDISRIMPDAMNRSLSAKSPVAPGQGASAPDPSATLPIAPLYTEDISRIMPDALNRSLSVRSPVFGAPGAAPPGDGLPPILVPQRPGAAAPTLTAAAPAAYPGALPGRPGAPGPAGGPGAAIPGFQDGRMPLAEDPDNSTSKRAPPKGALPLHGAPVLVDVTPRALVVETVGGFCDTVIPRNAKIPCEHTRVFATGRDLQTTVHVRVAQGEAPHFKENTLLGELELSGLRPAPRGDVTLSVSFELDADGTLSVRAIDTVSGREARATMKLVAVAQTEEEIEEMIERSRSVSVTGG